jgi:hypothetical protein
MSSPRSRPLSNSKARPNGEDVSLQRQTREDLEKALNELKQSEAQFRKIIDTIPAAPATTFLASDHARRITGQAVIAAGSKRMYTLR